MLYGVLSVDHVVSGCMAREGRRGVQIPSNPEIMENTEPDGGPGDDHNGEHPAPVQDLVGKVFTSVEGLKDFVKNMEDQLKVVISITDSMSMKVSQYRPLSNINVLYVKVEISAGKKSAVDHS